MPTENKKFFDFHSSLQTCLFDLSLDLKVLNVRGAFQHYFQNNVSIEAYIGESIDELFYKIKIHFPFTKEEIHRIKPEGLKRFKKVLLSNHQVHFLTFQLFPDSNDSLTLLIQDMTRIYKNYQNASILEEVIKIIPGSVYWKDRKGIYLGCNEYVAKIAGVDSSQEVVGKSDFDFPEWKPVIFKWRKHDEMVLRENQTISKEEEVVLPSGEKRTYFAVKAPLHNPEGDIIGILGNSLDITELKKTQEKLAESEKREAHFKAMSALSGMMAHELKTPLMAIALNASSIKDFFPILVKTYREYTKLSDTQEIREGYLDDLETIAEDIEVSARYAGNTIDTILSGFRYSTSESVSTEEIEVNTIIQQALNDYPLSKEEKELITFHPIGKCKALAATNIVIHVLHNLLKNALYAIQAANKGAITISVESTKNGDVAIQFRDTAKGIPREVREHIFDPFYTTKDTKTSIGLGLYFCKMALEKMNASITCESEEGEYALFIIELKGLSSETK